MHLLGWLSGQPKDDDDGDDNENEHDAQGSCTQPGKAIDMPHMQELFTVCWFGFSNVIRGWTEAANISMHFIIRYSIMSLLKLKFSFLGVDPTKFDS